MSVSVKDMMAGLRILIVDDEKAVRTALVRLLGTREEWVVVGEAADGAEAIGKAKELKPDVVIMDVTLPELNGLAATPEIKKAIPSTEILNSRSMNPLRLSARLEMREPAVTY